MVFLLDGLSSRGFWRLSKVVRALLSLSPPQPSVRAEAEASPKAASTRRFRWLASEFERNVAYAPAPTKR
jgi:hypothetical protein